MKQTVTESMFKDEFRKSFYKDNFTHEGLGLLFEYLEQYEQDYDNEIGQLTCTNAEAHLIAAAPDMLEALQSVNCECSPLFDHSKYCYMTLVESVIKKAKGQL